MNKTFTLSSRKLKKLLANSGRQGAALKQLVQQVKAGPYEVSHDAVQYGGWGHSQLAKLLGSKAAKRLMNQMIPVFGDESGNYMATLNVADIESARSLPIK